MNAFTSPSAFQWLNCANGEPTQAAEDLRKRWDTLHRAAQEIGAMAQLAKEPESPQISAFIGNVERMQMSRQVLIHNALADMEAILAPGHSALQSLHAKGDDVTAAAITLWCEFFRSRQAMLDLAGAE